MPEAKAKICTAEDRHGNQCELAIGHDGRHRNEYGEEWVPGAKGAKEPVPAKGDE